MSTLDGLAPRSGGDVAPGARRDEAWHPESGVLAGGLFIGPGFWSVGGWAWQVLLAVALVVLLRVLWVYRSSDIRRWRAALDAYAVREIGRGRRGKPRSA